jgi:hypothetical protein
VRCKTCYYSLANLSERRCPECGTPFNPRDPATLDHVRLFDLRLVAILLFVECLAFAYFLWSSYEVNPFEPQQATPSDAFNHALIFAVPQAAVLAMILAAAYVLVMLYRNRRFISWP